MCEKIINKFYKILLFVKNVYLLNVWAMPAVIVYPFKV